VPETGEDWQRVLPGASRALLRASQATAAGAGGGVADPSCQNWHRAVEGQLSNCEQFSIRRDKSLIYKDYLMSE
jgi:hypothetical protein